MSYPRVLWVLAAALFLVGTMFSSRAQEQVSTNLTIEERLLKAEKKIEANDHEIGTVTSALRSSKAKYASPGFVMFLFGGFCALWAQNTGRNAWLWFFLGFFFSCITVIVLYKNSESEVPRQ